MKKNTKTTFRYLFSGLLVTVLLLFASPAVSNQNYNLTGDFYTPSGTQPIGGNSTATNSGSGNQNNLQNTTPPSVDAVTKYMDKTMRPLWDVGATRDAGAQGLGFLILSSLFGIDVFTEMLGTDTVTVDGKQVVVEGPTQGIAVAMMSFAAQLAFLLLPILMGLLATTGLVNSLQFGEWFGTDQPSYYLAIRFLGGMVLAIPNPLFFGMSSIQQVIIVLALYSNGMGNFAAEMLVTATYESPGGARSVALAVGAIPPDPAINIDNMVNEVFLAQAIQQSCVANSRKLGINGREIAESCRAISGSLNPSAEGSGGLAGSQDDLDNATNSSANASCGGFEAREGFINSLTTRDVNVQYALCAFMTQAVANVRPKLEAAMELEGKEAKQAALLEAVKSFKTELGTIDGTVNSKLAHHAKGAFGYSNPCTSLPPDIKAQCEAAPDQFEYAAMADPLTSSRMIINATGWPGMGMLYYKVAGQIEAMNTTIREVGSETKFGLNNINEITRANSILRTRVHHDYALADVADSLVASTPSAHAVQDTGFKKAWSWFVRGLGLGLVQAPSNALDSFSTKANMDVSGFFADFYTAGSAPEAMYNYSATWLAIAGGAMIASDVIGVVSSSTGGGLKDSLGKMKSKVTSIFGNGGNDKTKTFTRQALEWAVKFILTFTTIIAFINVAVLPKLPSVFVAIMAVDWAINLLVIAFASPLWMLFNMSTAPAGKMLFTHTVLKGIQTLAWVLLYPTLIVFGVAVSMIIFNVSVPLIVATVAATYQDGVVSNVINMIMAPFMFMFLATVMGFASISLILRMPYQFAGFLGLSPMEGEMIKTASNYLGGESHLGQAQNQMSIAGINQAVR